MKKVFIILVFFTLCCDAKEPSGLKNQGATCYQNASLQCLNNINKLSDFLLNHKNDDYYMNEVNGKGSMAKVYIDLVENLRGGKKVYDPIGFCNIAEIWEFSKVEQMDAQDFVTALLNQLADEGVDPKYKSYYGYPAQGYIKTPVSQMFDVFLQSQIESSMCPVKSDKKLEPQKLVSLEVVNESGKQLASLNECFANFVQSEKLVGDNQWLCQATGQKVDARKKIELYSAPDVLILSLKRFEYNQATNRFNKLINPVTIPLSPDITPFYAIDSPQRDFAKYDLFGVTVHRGSLNGGHYWAYVKASDDKWYNANDSSVTLISSDDIQKLETQGYIDDQLATPYILYYKRKINIGFPAIPKLQLRLRIIKDAGVTDEILDDFLQSKKVSFDQIFDGRNEELLSTNTLVAELRKFAGLKSPEELALDLAQLEVELTLLKNVVGL